ncbi:hypothetical protein N431DRAFT_437596 [Stipitochalara longipes BDJ]|nr:hypothetical protein N431DRAFT_437596 [Stipitochalara longipes BDJ]
MGLCHLISPLTGTDIVFLLLVLFLALGIVRFLRRVIGDESSCFGHSFINELSLKSSPPLSSLPWSSLPRSPRSSSSLPVPVPVPAPPSVSSSLPSVSSSLPRSSHRPSGPVSPPVLSIKPVRLFQEPSSQSSSSPSPSSPSPADETVTLTGQKLLKELGLPATLASFRLLISLGVLDENLLPSSLLAPISVPASSPPPYVPPHFHYHLVVGTCYLNKRGELCLGPKRDEGLDENVEKRCSNPVVFSTSRRVFKGSF